MFIAVPEIAEDAVAHGFFGRKGGVSGGLYSSLNAGFGTQDDKDAVRENRARVAAALGGAAEQLVTVYQSHTPLCVTVDTPWDMTQPDSWPRADAMVTDRPGIMLGILTADCAPVLFTGQTAAGRPVAGAAHAGWKGAVGGVLENTVAAVFKLGATPASLRAVIGPCIGAASYEVAADFIAPFIAQSPDNAKFFTSGQHEGAWQFNLPAYVADRLRRAGVSCITDTACDTYKQADDYFSYRRTTHRAEADYGRQLSAISIKS